MSLEPKTLVVDASIAHAAGGEKAHHTNGIRARDFLIAVSKANHKIGMTPAIRDEWDRHQSDFARKWRKNMVATKKLVAQSVLKDEELRGMIDELDISQKGKLAMLKDCHLLEAAWAFDHRIASSDDIARNLFRQASLTIKIICELIWVNPIAEAEIVQNWLKQGAGEQPRWHLHCE